MNLDFIKKYLGALIAFFVFVVYLLTAQKSVMFWDSGEFIASGYKLQATHPPGAPFYSILLRIFLLFFTAKQAAYGAAIFSAICGSVTIWFLFENTVWYSGRILKKLNFSKETKEIAPYISASIAALTLAFSHTFWVSSTEAEVYTLSTLFMAASFWCVTKWDNPEQELNHNWLLLIIFLLGLSIGVHIMNLAVLFPICLVIGVRLYGLNSKGLAISFFGALFLFFFLNNLLVLGVLKFAAFLELPLVNSFGFFKHSGIILTIIILLTAVFGSIIYAKKINNKIIEFVGVGILIFCLGWSSYAMALLRTDAGTPISNNASNVFRLINYLQSDQYGFNDRPLVKGPVYNTPLTAEKPFKNGNPLYSFNNVSKKYDLINSGENTVPNFHNKLGVLFPRMFDRAPININGYNSWVHIEGEKAPIKINLNGRQQDLYLPTFFENLKFFFKFQLGWLNYRYFMWNFVGKQNSTKANGTALFGNWASGIPFLDSGRVGDSYQPINKKSNKDGNVFFFLPLALGVVGLVLLWKYNKADFSIILLFLLAFSVAITIFINQVPKTVLIRERDYIFLGAYYAFSLLVGIGFIGLLNWVKLKVPEYKKTLIIGGLSIVLVPGLMGVQSFNDHNRSYDNEAYQLALNMLNQCDENSILIASGDNVVFPIWYLQEVEGVRTDVRVCEYSLLGLDWYTNKLKSKINQSNPLKLGQGIQLFNKKVYPIKQKAINEHININEIFNFLVKPENQYLPTSKLLMKVDTNKLKLNADLNNLEVELTNSVKWNVNKTELIISDLILLDIIRQNINDRSIYFSNTGDSDFYQGLDNYLVNKGLVNQFMPVVPKASKKWDKLNESNSLYKLLMEDLSFDYYRDSLNFISAENKDFAKNTYIPLFYALANDFAFNKKRDKVIEVLDKCVEMFPDKNIPYGQNMFKIARIYYNIGEIDKARNITGIVMNRIFDKMDLLTSFKPQNEIITNAYCVKIGEELSENMISISKLDKEFVKTLEPRANDLSIQFGDWIENSSLLQKRLRKIRQQQNSNQKNKNTPKFPAFN